MTMRTALFVWDGDAMVPLPRFKTLCDRQFVVHEEYALAPVENVSVKSRAHLFAAIKDAWDNLLDDDKRFPHPETLRKWALVQVGHCTETDFVLDTERDARATALALRKADEYAVIIRRGKIVKFCTAKSIASNVVKHEEFQAVKTRVMDLLATMIDVNRSDLAKSAGRSA